MQMTTLKVFVFTEVREKRTADGTTKYNATGITPDNLIAHVSCTQEKMEKLKGFCLLKGFRINPKATNGLVFADHTEASQVCFFNSISLSLVSVIINFVSTSAGFIEFSLAGDN